jgi:TonB-linked SusC/RagA family outer membrane protein
MKENYLHYLIMLSRHALAGTFLLGILIPLALASGSDAQKHYSVREVKVELEFKGSDLSDVFKTIESVTSFKFIYFERDVLDQATFSMSKKNMAVSDLLLQLSKNYNLGFKQVNSNITVRKINKGEDTPKLEIFIQARAITGRVTSSEDGETLPGVNVIELGTTNGTITDLDGRYAISVNEGATLVFSSVGYLREEIPIGARSVIDVALLSDIQALEEVVIVGYGQQKKQSVVGAIATVDSEELMKTRGPSNLAQSLTGRLPGVTTITSTGEPGNDDPLIFIRGQSTWNNAQPLILVDGIERKMNDVDPNEVESISILKDASATAVFGVKGAEGVILITTKRGQVGRAQLSASANTGIKLLSRVPKKMDSYDGLSYRNNAIEYELPLRETGWPSYIPQSFLNRYRMPGDELIAPGVYNKDVFPNVDWAEEMTKDFGQQSQVNLNVRGGSKFAKYFASVGYLSDGDILKSGLDNGLGYQTKWGYDRFNYRTNLDFNLTPTTTFTTNVAGYVGTKYESYFTESGHGSLFLAFYALAPSAFPVKHSDGLWGYSEKNTNESNPVKGLNTHGLEKIIRSQINTDFKLVQKLDFITKGLSVQGSVSYDNMFVSTGGIFQIGSGQSRYIDPNIINMQEGETLDKYIYYSPRKEGFAYVPSPPSYQAEGIRVADYWGENNNLAQTTRKLFYQGMMNYARQFQKHDLGVTALVNREEYARGSMFPTYREDWVSRITYNYDQKYLFETNGAYNGSERFGQGYRFGFFPSVALGWVASNESFVNWDWLNKLKFRYSIGKVGNDDTGAGRWAYVNGWAIESWRIPFGYSTQQNSPYPQYAETIIGNPNLQWEESVKQNFGIELAVLKNMFSLNIDLFKDDRDKIFMSSGQRTVPVFYGRGPVAANLGETTTKGYEVELSFQNSGPNGLFYWGKWSYTYAKDKILFMEDAELLPAYQKREGFQIGQTKTTMHDGFLNNWDDVFSSTHWATNQNDKLPGDLRVIDFNGDGQIDGYDNAPYGFPMRPQNTYNFSFGGEYKGFSAYLQFYGVYNVHRPITSWNQIQPFGDRLQELVFDLQSDYWSKDNPDARFKAGRFMTDTHASTLYLFDGSYLRLKTAEVAYTFNQSLLKNVVNSARLYLNGNNLFFWSDMPDDREDNSGRLLYPTMKRFTVGLDITF